MQLVTVSQHLFDEVCEENLELMDEGDNLDDILKDAIKQVKLLQQQQQQKLNRQSETNSNDDDQDDALVHLTLTLPTSKEGKASRKMRNDFIEALEGLERDTDVNKALQTVYDGVNVDNLSHTNVPMLRRLFIHESGPSRLISLWNKLDATSASDQSLQRQIVDTFLTLGTTCGRDIKTLKHTTSLFLNDFRRAISQDASSWFQVASFQLDHSSSSSLEPLSFLNDVLQIIILSCRRSEANKVIWVQLEVTDSPHHTLPELLTTVLQSDVCQESVTLLSTAATLVVVLCTFDEFLSTSAEPTRQASHASVTALTRAGVAPALFQLLEKSPKDPEISSATSRVSLRASLFSALRALAIQNDVVTSMMSLGVVDLLSKDIVQNSETIGAGEENEKISTAIVGLIRNLCGNDDVKCRLCNSDAVMWAISSIANTHHSRALQEHVSGTVGAMALRQPQNSERLVTLFDLHTVVIRGMQRHLDSSSLQRQGALALRNLVSRTPQLRPKILDAGAEQALVAAAAHHPGCQDEVYAALRDMGKEPRLLRFERDDVTGETRVRSQPQMFGDVTNPNFRPVYDVSA